MKMLVLAVALALGACVPQPTMQSKVLVQTDQFSPAVTFVGPPAFVNPFGGITRNWMLRSFLVKKTGERRHQVYVTFTYSSPWKFFVMAADDTARALPVERIGSDVGGCSSVGCIETETLVITVDEGSLVSRAVTGYPIKISARSGDAVILAISPQQIKLQLRAMADYLHVPPPV